MGEKKWGEGESREKEGFKEVRKRHQVSISVAGEEDRSVLPRDPGEDTLDTRKARILARSFFLCCKLQSSWTLFNRLHFH